MGFSRFMKSAVPRAPWARMAVAAALIACLPGLAVAADTAVVKLWNYNIHDKKYQQKMYKLFNERHPDIRLEYTSISNTVYDQTLEAAYIAKEPPDMFEPAGKLTFTYLRTNKMIMPLNDVAPTAEELKKWMDGYPEAFRARFAEGKSLFNGKIYNVDLRGVEDSPGYPLFYNKTLFKEAGIEKPPATYSELRGDAAKITSAGSGKYFGMVRGGRVDAMWHYDLSASLATAGGALGVSPYMGPSLKDGKFHYGSPEFTNALQVWINMLKDGSVFPGDLMMEDEQAKMTLATNKAAMQFGYWWNPGNYLAYNPDCDFDLVLPPTPDDGVRKGFLLWNPNAGGPSGYVVSSFAKYPHAVWEVIKFVSSLEYQEGYVKGGYGVSYLPEANKRENFTIPQMYKFVEWGMDPAWRRIAPLMTAGAMSEDLLRTYWDFMPGIYPGFKDVVDSVYTGKAGFEALKDLDDRSNAAFDTAIAKAQAAGLKVTKSDFIFPDWDPTKDYKFKSAP